MSHKLPDAVVQRDITIDNAHNTEQDDAAMVKVGKIQQVRRNFGFWTPRADLDTKTILGMTASMMCTWEAVFFANLTAMLNGGPPSLIYGFIYAFFGALSTTASLAEMASMYPTSGGQYHWTAVLAPPAHSALLSWFCGWIATLGWIANTATGAFFAATMIQAVLVQNFPQGYEFHRWQGTLLMWAVLLVVFVINSVGTRLLAVVEGMVLVLHLSAFFAVLIPLLYFSRHGSSRQVWVEFQNRAGWRSDGLAWWVGLLSSNLPLIGYDGPCHMAEEVSNAPTVVPRAMIMTVLINGPLGWAICIALGYTILPTFDTAISSPTGYDYIEVFYAAVGKAGTAGMAALLVLLVWCATFGFLATASRQTWAFARDRGLPFSNYFAKVNKRLAIPLRSIVLCSVIPCLLGLIDIGSTVALNAMISLTIAGIFISYLIPIVLLLIKKTSGDEILYGPFKMPSALGMAVNVFSAIFLTLSTFFSFFPPTVNPNLVTMNWSCAVFGGFVITGFVWYALLGRKQYHGPVIERPILVG